MRISAFCRRDALCHLTEKVVFRDAAEVPAQRYIHISSLPSYTKTAQPPVSVMSGLTADGDAQLSARESDLNRSVRVGSAAHHRHRLRSGRRGSASAGKCLAASPLVHPHDHAAFAGHLHRVRYRTRRGGCVRSPPPPILSSGTGGGVGNENDLMRGRRRLSPSSGILTPPASTGRFIIGSPDRSAISEAFPMPTATRPCTLYRDAAAGRRPAIILKLRDIGIPAPEQEQSGTAERVSAGRALASVGIEDAHSESRPPCRRLSAQARRSLPKSVFRTVSATAPTGSGYRSAPAAGICNRRRSRAFS